MKNFFTRYQNFIIGLVVVVGGFIIYTYFVPPSTDTLVVQPVVAGTAVDQELISFLLELKSITLPDALFSDPGFRSLQDFNQELVPEPVGRNNPFAPLGR